MAFPTIADADTKSGTVVSNSTSWTLTYPTNIVANDLLLAFVAVDGTASSDLVFPANWIVAASIDNAANNLNIAKKKAVGTETGTFTVTVSASEQGAWRIFRLPAAGWEGTLGTDYRNLAASASVVTATSIVGSPSTSPDPPSLDPNNWATEDTLWIAACSIDTSRAITGYPANMADRHTADVSGGAGGATLGLATAISAVSSLDPGAFTTTSDDWAAATVAVRPAAAATPLSPPFRSKSIHNALVR